MNKINPAKLLNSKWTAVKPSHKEKHFLVTEIEFDEQDCVIACVIEAVMTKRTMPLNWQDLKDDNIWLQGWK
ncbi:TIGR02450 family Trp-rich protein [Shewanella sp. OMA3-2]|uniref:TIGR02450 family Trp-rich protein n=1 Tax=Shewanella sp. OMA3-2 TaxID=2908650 RepID=UPI001F385B2E|nr:TIGR02450 family Trp-rich protein [Shewanella sp. OMA3-2]UJF23229.1 TIGR02450 family Trp-rich protein [Shewanella sp. OMA3-2]